MGGGVAKSRPCGSVMDAWVREAGVGQGREGGERTVEAHPGVTEGCQIRTCERSKVRCHNLFISQHVVCVCTRWRVLPVSRDDRSPSDDRDGESGLAVCIVGVAIWPR